MLISLNYCKRYQMISVKIRQQETFRKCTNMNLQLAVGNITKYNNESLSGSLFHWGSVFVLLISLSLSHGKHQDKAVSQNFKPNMH